MRLSGRMGLGVNNRVGKPPGGGGAGPAVFAQWMGDSENLHTNSDGTGGIADGWGIGYLPDESGNGHHVIQPSTPSKPIFNAATNAIRCNGSSHFLRNILLSPQMPDDATIVFCGIRDVVSTADAPFGVSVAGNDHMFFRPAVGWLTFALDMATGDIPLGITTWNEIFMPTATASIIMGTYETSDALNGYAHAHSYAGGSLTSQSDGPRVGSPTLSVFDYLCIGAGSFNDGPFWYWDGDIYEVIIYPEVLDADQLAAVGAYLAAKWSVT